MRGRCTGFSFTCAVALHIQNAVSSTLHTIICILPTVDTKAWSRHAVIMRVTHIDYIYVIDHAIRGMCLAEPCCLPKTLNEGCLLQPSCKQRLLWMFTMPSSACFPQNTAALIPAKFGDGFLVHVSWEQHLDRMLTMPALICCPHNTGVLTPATLNDGDFMQPPRMQRLTLTFTMPSSACSLPKLGLLPVTLNNANVGQPSCKQRLSTMPCRACFLQKAGLSLPTAFKFRTFPQPSNNISLQGCAPCRCQHAVHSMPLVFFPQN